MSAVSLSDAWNDLPPPPSIDQAGSTSARASRSMSSTLSPPDLEDPETISPAQTTITGPEHTSTADVSLELILEEFRALRNDEARRCTVYLAVGGVLFAILFVYIDRLHQQIRFTNNFVVQRQSLLSSSVPEMSRTPYKLPQPW